jgi:serine/threonine protein kinase
MKDHTYDLEGLEDYTILNTAHEGLYSRVFHAMHKVSGELVYIKVSKLPFPISLTSVQLAPENCHLRSEYRITKDLSASIPNVIQAIDFVSSNGCDGIILEDFGGVNLRQVLRTNGPYKSNVNAFLDLAIQVASVLRKRIGNLRI